MVWEWEWVWTLVFSALACLGVKVVVGFVGELKVRRRLPPGPLPLPLIGNLHQIGLEEMEPKLQKLHDKYGPIITVYQGTERHVFVAGHETAHMALVKNGAAFGNRIPAAPENFRLFGGNESEPFIGFTDCGPLWRAFRRNLNTELLSSAKLTSFAGAREEVVQKLFRMLRKEAAGGTGAGGGVVRPLETFRFVLFALGMSMCFGGELLNIDEDEEMVLEQMAAVRESHQNLGRFFVFHVFPRSGKYLFPKMWKEMMGIRRRLVRNLHPLVQARIRKMAERENHAIECYADSLIALKLPEGGKLKETEITTLCYEFLTAGVSTVVSSLQWAMANLVKHPEVQSKVYEEINKTVGGGGGDQGGTIVKEEDLKKMPYVKAVVLETLRKHPPIHTLLPHRVTEEMEMEGYSIPKDTFVNFMLVSMGRDPKVWEDPMAFRPERFLHRGDEAPPVDLTGTREIKMIPFGAGRRVCPGVGIGTLHLEFLVANLVKQFQWSAVDGEEVDLTETMHNDIDYSMKTPLRAHIIPRKDN
ncbi:hypothetical protein H6P81_008395 [Aristolochia fimbriata]|uniref:Cytochrome P450 n=1 Tax=Aristolochia fimbriata TaxID=158543 RepID=A0AAV7F6M4_ARIFI|nr:hypothetical protein H6P81_008395 [Aristolochia fimbriata]